MSVHWNTILFFILVRMSMIIFLDVWILTIDWPFRRMSPSNRRCLPSMPATVTTGTTARSIILCERMERGHSRSIRRRAKFILEKRSTTNRPSNRSRWLSIWKTTDCRQGIAMAMLVSLKSFLKTSTITGQSWWTIDRQKSFSICRENFSATSFNWI